MDELEHNMGTRLHPSDPLSPAHPRTSLRRRPWLAWLVLLCAVLPACNTLPDPYLDPQGSETTHTVIETIPGQWHVLVRVNYFSSDDAAERLLRDRVADLCPAGDLVVENLHVAGVPRIATADVHCAGSETTAAPTTEAPTTEAPTAGTPPTEAPETDMPETAPPDVTTGDDEVVPPPDTP